MFLHALKNLKHLVGSVGILITLDFFLFDGFCTQACSEALSQASSQIHLDLIKDFSPSQIYSPVFLKRQNLSTVEQARTREVNMGSLSIWHWMIIIFLGIPIAIILTRRAKKTCPQCAEQIKAAALVCRFCGYEFQKSPSATPGRMPE